MSLIRAGCGRRPPVGRARENRKFILAPSLEIWRKTISGAERGSGEEVGWPVFGYLLGKKFRGRARDHVVPRSSLPCRGVLSFRSEAREASGSETARLHRAHRRRGGLAARGAGAAAGHCPAHRRADSPRGK